VNRLLAWILPHAWWIAAAAGLALLGALGAQTIRLAHADQALAELQSAWTADRLRGEQEARALETRYRAEEQRRDAAHQKEIEDADQKAMRARADAAVADAAAGKLRNQVASLIAAARQAASDPRATEAGAPATDAAGVLADVFGQCVARVRVLAAEADQRGNAGGTCERLYDSLTRETVGE
jgi:hypothetical protein